MVKWREQQEGHSVLVGSPLWLLSVSGIYMGIYQKSSGQMNEVFTVHFEARDFISVK